MALGNEENNSRVYVFYSWSGTRSHRNLVSVDPKFNNTNIFQKQQSSVFGHCYPHATRLLSDLCPSCRNGDAKSIFHVQWPSLILGSLDHMPVCIREKEIEEKDETELEGRLVIESKGYSCPFHVVDYCMM